MSATQLGYLGLAVSNLDQWEEFAREILGLEVSERLSDGTIYLRMDEQHHRFIVHPDGKDDVAYVGWQVPGAAALEELRDKLEGIGVECEQATADEREHRKVVDFIKFEDPNGLRLEAFYGLLLDLDHPFKSPRPIGRFKTGEYGLGHIVLRAKDLETTTRFYTDVLGFRISDYIDMQRGEHQMRLVFFHCNPRHHSLAFSQFPSPRVLSHVMLELESLDDVGITQDLCVDKGVPIVRPLGKHSNDLMISFYVESPAGFQVEYGYGGRLVDDSTWVVQYHKRSSIWGHGHGVARAPELARSG